MLSSTVYTSNRAIIKHAKIKVFKIFISQTRRNWSALKKLILKTIITRDYGVTLKSENRSFACRCNQIVGVILRTQVVDRRNIESVKILSGNVSGNLSSAFFAVIPTTPLKNSNQIFKNSHQTQMNVWINVSHVCNTCLQHS